MNVTRSEAISKLRILLGEAAASSHQRGETNEQFLETLKAMRSTIDHAIDLTIDSCIEDKRSF